MQKQSMNQLHYDDTDIDDDLSLGFSKEMEKGNKGGDTFFEISSNFIEDEEITDIKHLSQHIFDLKKKKPRELDAPELSVNQINKLNQVNQSIRFLMAFEFEFARNFRELMKQQSLKQHGNRQQLSKSKIAYGNDQEILLNNLRQKIQALMYDRVGPLLQQKKAFFLGKKDKTQIRKKKLIQTLIQEYIKTFKLKKNSKVTGKTLQSMKKLADGTQKTIKQTSSVIKEKKIQGQISRIAQQELDVTREKMKKACQANAQRVKQIHQKIERGIKNKMQAQQTKTKMKVLREVQLQKRLLQEIEDPMEVISSKDLFNLMPFDFKQNNNNSTNVHSFVPFV